MKQLLERIKTLLRDKPATVSGTLTLIVSNLIIVGVVHVNPEQQAAISSTLTVVVMIAANLIAPTKPKRKEVVLDSHDQERSLKLQEDL